MVKNYTKIEKWQTYNITKCDEKDFLEKGEEQQKEDKEFHIFIKIGCI